MNALVKEVANGDRPMAEHLRQFLATGQTHPYGFVWTTGGIELQGTQYVVVRVLPKLLGVRFACRCARAVFPYLEEAHPSERSPQELIELVEAWPSRTVTKTQIREKWVKLGEFGSRISEEWYRAYGEGKFDAMSSAERNLSQRPKFAVDVVGNAAQSVGLSKSSTAWLRSIDRTVDSHFEVESIGKGKRVGSEQRNGN
jgi:hypothetical protein